MLSASVSPMMTMTGPSGSRSFSHVTSAALPCLKKRLSCVKLWVLGDQARILMRAGVSRDRICIDPGPGFDKFADEDIVIQGHTPMVSWATRSCAVSRKRFVGAVSGVSTAGIGMRQRRLFVLPPSLTGPEFSVCMMLRVPHAINSFWAMTEKDSRQGFVALAQTWVIAWRIWLAQHSS